MLNLIGRDKELFTEDINQHEKELQQIVFNSRFWGFGDRKVFGY